MRGLSSGDDAANARRIDPVYRAIDAISYRPITSGTTRDITDRSSKAYPIPGGASVRSWTTDHEPLTSNATSTAYVVSHRRGVAPTALIRYRSVAANASAGTTRSATK